MWKIDQFNYSKTKQLSIGDGNRCEIEHGFVENFIQLFSLRDKFRKLRDDINENGFSSKYPSLMGNIVF